MPSPLRTQRFELVPATPRHLDLTDHGALAALLEADVPPDWPPEMVREARPSFLSMLRVDPFSEGGTSGTSSAPRTTAGCSSGGAGLSAALIGWAFDDPGVTCVFARTYADLTPSIRLLRRLGFTPAGEEEGGVRVRYDLSRAQWDGTSRWGWKKEGSIPAFP